MNNKLLSLLSALIIIILGVWGFTSLMDSNNDEDDKNDSSTSTSMVDTDDSDDEDPLSSAIDSVVDNDVVDGTTDALDSATSSLDAASLLESLVGEKSGVSSLLLSTLTFPESVMTTNADQTFTLEAKGFDLAILGNESLAVEQGVYPLVRASVGGDIMATTGNVNLNVTSLTPSFYVLAPNGTETELEPEVQTQILAGLQAAGISIPEVTPTTPAVIPVSVTPSATGFVIESTSSSPFFARFETL